MKKTLKNLFYITKLDQSADFTIDIKADSINFISDNTDLFFEVKYNKKEQTFENISEYNPSEFHTHAEFKSKCLIIANALIKKEKNISKIELFIFNQFYNQ